MGKVPVHDLVYIMETKSLQPLLKGLSFIVISGG